ncbi:hypothetical protein K3495_g6560 [Podosphaera aphanis]|nr:hypothetical protein K3495_g6560 [Podosphaera aphanis]
MLLAKSLLKNASVQASDMLRVSNMDFNNFRRKQLKLTAQLDPDCWNSLQKYVDLIRKEGGIAIIQGVPEDRVGNRSVFMFAFCTSWQTDVFRKYTSLLCLDSTHNTCYTLNDKGRKAFLYSIVVQHDKGECGIPVAFMITSSETQRPLARWLMWLEQILPLQNTPIFMIDCSSTEMAAIGSVFIRPEIRLCYWHMLRAMRSQANNKISSPLIAAENPNSRSRKDRSSQIRESAMGDFVKSIHTETVDKFGDAWATYQVKYSGYEEWMIYLSSNWLCQAEKWWSGNRYNMLNINTNNLIESWHRSLKTEYLGSVRKQRIDLLVYLLLEDVSPDFCVKVGRIINGLDNRRRSDTEQKQLALSVALANEIASSFIRQEAVPRGCDHYSKALSCRSFEKKFGTISNLTLVSQ